MISFDDWMEPLNRRLKQRPIFIIKGKVYRKGISTNIRTHPVAPIQQMLFNSHPRWVVISSTVLRDTDGNFVCRSSANDEVNSYYRKSGRFVMEVK
jgi:hypothetical protein